MRTSIHKFNPKTTKHKESLKLTHFSHYVAISRFNFIKTPYQEFKEETQEIVVENTMSADFFQFQGQQMTLAWF